MNAAPLVVAFSESRAVRETLRVLLEADCELRFLNAHSMPAPQALRADLALVAVRDSSGLLQRLTHGWPTLPIVAVRLTTGSLSPTARVASVPLDPHAIRSAVLRRISATAEAPLVATARSIGEALHAEVAQPLAALRSCTAAWGRGSGTETLALVPLVWQQSQIIAQAVDQLDRFLLRARDAHSAADFLPGLRRELERPDHTDLRKRTLVWISHVSDDQSLPVGPVSLIPPVASFLRAHVFRRCDGRIVRLTVDRQGALLRYPARPALQPAPSWPLLLAAFALKPRGWRVESELSEAEEVVRLRPA